MTPIDDKAILLKRGIVRATRSAPLPEGLQSGKFVGQPTPFQIAKAAKDKAAAAAAVSQPAATAQHST